MIANWITHLYGLLPHPDRSDILWMLTSDGLELPSAFLNGRMDMAQIDLVHEALRPVIGLPFHVLHCLARDEHPDEQRIDALFLLELPAEFDESMNMRASWRPLKDADLSGMLPKLLQMGLEKWSNVRDIPVSTPGADWSQPGWYAQAENWIRTQLADHGFSLRVVEPLKSWAISVVLRAQTEENRTFYFKASRALPLFVNEGKVMTRLAKFYPANIPLPMAVDEERGWMLLADIGPPLRGRATFQQQVQMYQTMARLQVDSVNKIETLLQTGCIYRPIPWLQERLDELMSDEISLSKLHQEERVALVRVTPRLRAILEALDALPLPSALVHGDLHVGNVAVVNGEIQIFDWTDAAVSHPFFDIFDIFTEQDVAKREKLETAYSAIWNEAYPEVVVRRGLQLARVVYGLYHALSYSVIVNNLGPDEREDLNGAHYFFRQLLDGLAREESLS